MKKLPFKELFIVICTLVVFGLVGEVVLRLYLQHHIIYDIEMSRYSTLAKIDSKNPLIGHVHKPGAKARLMGTQVTINNDGLRDDTYSKERNEKYRIVFLGDSLTFGWGVEKNESFEHLLEAKLNQLKPTEILNFGTGNYNTAQEVNLFLEKGLAYQPDHVVVFYFINDAEVTPKKSKLWFLGHSQIITFYWSKFHILKNRLNPSTNFKQYYADLYTPNQSGWLAAQSAFKTLKKVCDQRNITLQVVLLPELHSLTTYPFTKEHEVVTTFLASQNISHTDLTPSFQWIKQPQELWVALDDAHPNQKAHQLIADYAAPFIKQPLVNFEGIS